MLLRDQRNTSRDWEQAGMKLHHVEESRFFFEQIVDGWLEWSSGLRLDLEVLAT